MLPGDGITAGIGKDKTCFTDNTQYSFQHTGLNTSDIKEYIRNPHKFNTKQEMDGKYLNLWSTDNERTDGNDEVVIKSVYDPSPVGYSLPASNAFTGFTTTGGNTNNPVELNVKGDFDKGRYFYTKPNKQGNIFWFPACGSRSFITGSLEYVSAAGYCWTAGVENGGRAIELAFDINFIFPIDTDPKTNSHSVRSAEEKETHKFNIKEEMEGQYYNLWSTDNAKTEANDDVVIKSVYDPSPVGYSLPASNAFTGFTITGQKVGDWTNPLTPEERAQLNVKGDFDKGYYFYTKKNKQGIPFFFPACGFRYRTTGSLGLVTRYGFPWVAGPADAYFGRCLGFHSDAVYPLSSAHRSYGFSVRSAEEKIVLVWLR